MRVKVRKKDESINVFGGLNFINNQVKKLKLAEHIDNFLGKRKANSKYTYSQVLLSWVNSTFCGNKKIFQIESIRKYLNLLPNQVIPSHDTIGRVFKSLKAKTQSEESIGIRKMVTNTTNYNQKLNNFLASTLNLMGILKNKQHILDIDTIVLPTTVNDATLSYKKDIVGYNPCVAFIDKLCVGVEGRLGNVSPKYKILDFYKKTIKNLEKNNIQVDKIRIDAAGYSAEIFDYLNSTGKQYYIRAHRTVKLKNLYNNTNESDWQKAEMELSEYCGEYLFYSVEHELYTGLKCRCVMYKKLRKRETVQCIITNDMESSDEEIIRLYLDRGNSERNFDYLRNDFGWKYPPFSNLAENTVFYIMAAFCNNLYQYILEVFSKKTEGIKTTFRLTTFIRKVIRLATKTFNNNVIEIRDVVQDIDYSMLMT